MSPMKPLVQLDQFWDTMDGEEKTKAAVYEGGLKNS